MQLSVLEFRRRFTTEEKVAIDLSSIDNPAADMQTRSMQAALRVYSKDLETAAFVDTKDPATVYGIQSLVQFGILTQERMSEILAETIITENTDSVYLETGTLVFNNAKFAVKDTGTYLLDQLVDCYDISDDLKRASAGFFPSQILEVQSEAVE